MDSNFETPTADRVFELAAELFALLSTPARLRIVCALCDGEQSVGELHGRLNLRQPNISQHLAVLYRSGIVGRRKSGSQVFYRIVSDRALILSDAVCGEHGGGGAH